MSAPSRAADRTVPDWAIGCMKRDYVIVEGERDHSIAIWIQTGAQYVDIRIPHDRPPFLDHRSLRDFGPAELHELARQSGDTGVCAIESGVATWTSWGDRFGFFCDEVAVFPDDGCVALRRGTIFETQTPKSRVTYEEAWVQQPYDHGLVAHLTLRSVADPTAVLGVLLVTGRHAGFVASATSANRSSLQKQLAAADGDAARMRRILDCEASYAVRARAGTPFIIRHSSLPFREGSQLDAPVLDRSMLERRATLPARRDGAQWRVESWFVNRRAFRARRRK